MITKKKKSQLQEKKVADEINADVVVASGALWGSKGDVRSDELLIECKTTDNSYYVFHFATWDKIRKEAIKDGLRIPVMSIDILGGKRRFAVFNSKDFEEHKGFKDMYFGTYALYVYKGSFRLTDPCIFYKISVPYDRESVTDTYCVVPWEDFVRMYNEK